MFKPGKLPKNSVFTPEQLRTDFLHSLPYLVKQSLFLESNIVQRLRELGDVGNLIFITDVSKKKLTLSLGHQDQGEQGLRERRLLRSPGDIRTGAGCVHVAGDEGP